MFIVADERLLHEFLVEAGEIVEQLGGQLVELEQRPQDQELLNTVFRGFHTIKGGASFLSLDALVQVCHHAEDVFNLLRRGERAVDAGLMDAVLQALDTVNAIFQCLRAGQELPTPEPALLAALGALADRAARRPPPCGRRLSRTTSIPPVGRSIRRRSVTRSGGPGVRTARRARPPAAAPGAGDEITDDEFDALLDALHGPGAAPGGSVGTEARAADPLAPVPAPGAIPVVAAKPPAAATEPATGTPLQAEATVRVDTRRLDHIMNMVGELVLVRNRLVKLDATRSDEEMTKTVANIDRVTADLQLAVMKTRMQPIGKVFGRFRVVRDLARSLHKKSTSSSWARTPIST